MKKTSYYTTELKRDFKLLPSVLVPLLAISVVFAVICSLALIAMSKSQNRQLIKIGLVGNTSGTYLGFGIDVIKNYDTSKFEIDFVRLNEEEAREKLKNNEITSFIIVPKGFVTSLVKGKDAHITYVSNNNESYFAAQIIKYVAKAVANSVSPAEAGIYSMHRIARKNGFTEEEIDDADVDMSLKNISFVLNRTSIFSPEVLGVSDNLTSEQYYFCALIFFIFMIWGAFCHNILRPKSLSFSRYLKSRGIGALRQILAEYLAFFTVSALVAAALFFVTAAIIGSLPNVPEGFSHISALDGLLFSIKVIPTLFMITSFEFMLYKLIDSAGGVILGQFIFALILSYLAGCFYPIDFFPIAYQKIINFFPNGAGFSYIRQSFSGDVSPLTLCIVVGYALIFLLISVTVHKLRTERGKGQ